MKYRQVSNSQFLSVEVIGVHSDAQSFVLFLMPKKKKKRKTKPVKEAGVSEECLVAFPYVL